jgi:small ligand-binding sensory domain FIST
MTAMFPFACAADASATTAAREVGKALKIQQGDVLPPLGLVYVSSMFVDEVDVIVETLIAATGVQAWTGSVSLGVIAGSEEFFGRPAVSAMLLDVPEDAVQPFGPIESLAGFRAASGQAKAFGGDIGTALGIIHADPTGDPTGNGIASLPSEFAEAGGLYLVGGLCSGENSMPAITSSGAASGAVAGALVSLEVGVVTGVSQGCAPIGPTRVVETVDSGVLSKLGEQSAFAAMLEDLGISDNPSLDDLRAALEGVHIALPVKGADRKDYVVRNITGIDAERGLVGIADMVEDGASAFFCRRDAVSAAKDLREMASDAVKRLGRPPRGGLYVSCLARGPNLFGPNSEEIAIVREAIGGDCPVLGFFANGEIAHDRLYGYTGVLTVFG